MLKKAQAEPIPILMGIAGAVIGWIIAGQMEAGIFLKILATAITGLGCYVMVAFMSR